MDAVQAKKNFHKSIAQHWARDWLAKRMLVPVRASPVPSVVRKRILPFSTLLFACAPGRPSKILLVQVGTLSSSPIPRCLFSFFLSLPPPPSPPAHHRGSAARAGGEQLLPPLAPLSPSTHAPGVCAVCAVPAAAGHDWPSRCGDARHDAWWWLVNDVEAGMGWFPESPLYLCSTTGQQHAQAPAGAAAHCSVTPCTSKAIPAAKGGY